MSSLRTIREASVGSFKHGITLLLSISDDKMEEIFSLQDQRPFSAALTDSSLSKKFESEVCEAAGLTKEKGRQLVETLVNLEQLDSAHVIDFKEDMKILSLKKTQIDRTIKIVKTIQRRGIHDKAADEMAKRDVVRRVLPSLISASVAYDVRYLFKGNKIRTKLPVLLVALGLRSQEDNKREYVRFQMTSPMLKSFISNLRETYKKLQLLEKNG